MKKTCLFVFLISIFSMKAFCFEYILPRPQNDKDLRQQYRLELLQLALDKTASEYKDDKRILARFSNDLVNHSRAINEIIKNAGDVTIIGSGYSKDREKKMYLINVEILNKINHYKISFVNKNFIEKFQSIKSIEDLKQFPLCRKKDWFDAAYGPNGFKVELGADYEGIFKMLNSGRCVWFPRGVNEIFDEYKEFKNQLTNVVIDDKIAIMYDANVFFFVSKENKQYGDRIEKGINLAKKDGSFQKLFELKFKDDLENAKLDKRKIFRIKHINVE